QGFPVCCLFLFAKMTLLLSAVIPVAGLPVQSIMKRSFLDEGIYGATELITVCGYIQSKGWNITGLSDETKFEIILSTKAIATAVFTCEFSSSRTTPLLGKPPPRDASSARYPLLMWSDDATPSLIGPSTFLRGSGRNLIGRYGAKLRNTLLSRV